MIKYLYLTEKNWVKPWIEGGFIPISPASTYLADFREGTKTPDENLIHESPVDLYGLKPLGFHIEEVKGLTMIDCVGNGIRISNFIGANLYTEDGLILSFCNKKSSDICIRLGKKACIVIHDIYTLKHIIDEQLGVVGIAGDCRYTKDHQRNHFLKSIDDEWQSEFRIFWPLKKKCKVKLPSGIGRSIKIKI